MLTVADVLRNLSLGVFSNLSLGDEGSGAIKEDRIPNVLLYLNEGLTELHTQFVLSEKILTLLTFGHKSNYSLTADNSFANNGMDYDPEAEDPDGPNIIDSDEEPFQEDIIKIMSVYTSDGWKLPLNDLESSLSVFTPHSGLLQVPNPDAGHHLSIEYQANHAQIQWDECGKFLTQKVDIPPVLHDALYSYIAYKVYSSMNTQENNAKAREHLELFNLVCRKVVDRDLVSESRSFTNTKFHKGGWV